MKTTRTRSRTIAAARAIGASLALIPALIVSAHDCLPAQAPTCTVLGGIAHDRGRPDAGPRCAWCLLGEGRYALALQRFEHEMRRGRDRWRSTVGVAVSQAALGDLRRGASTMGRVLGRDPEALGRITIDPPLRRRLLDALVADHHALLVCDGADQETLVALGAIHLLRGDDEGVHLAITAATHVGGRTTPVASLRRLAGPGPKLVRTTATAREPLPVITTPGSPVGASSVARPPASNPRALFARAVAPSPDETTSPPTPPEPAEPVDYDALRRKIRAASAALDRFSRKLLGAAGMPGSLDASPGDTLAQHTPARAGPPSPTGAGLEESPP